MIRSLVFPILLGSLLLAAACDRPAQESTPATPDRDAARIRMAQTLLQQGHVNEAIEQLRKLPPTAEHSIGPLAQPDWFEPVVAQLVLRRALDEADSMLALTGPVADRSSKLRALSANVMVLRGDPEGAIATWASIQSNDPDMQVQVYHELATLYMMTGRVEEAEVQAREGLVLEPDRWQVRLLLAESLLEQGRSGEALDEVQKLDANSVRWMVEARIELEGFERADRAVDLLEKANRAAPRNPDIRLQLARAYLANGQYDQARSFLEPLASSPVPFSGSRETLVEVYDALGEDELAAPLRDQLRREGEFAEAQELRLSGLQSSVAGDLEAALREFDRALEIDPADPNLHNDRGAVLARLERYGEAETAFRRAEELAPEDPVVQENLARLYQRTGNEELRDSAIARWQELTGGQAPTPE
jgi:Flp pilus assembly protein TadD